MLGWLKSISNCENKHIKRKKVNSHKMQHCTHFHCSSLQLSVFFVRFQYCMFPSTDFVLLATCSQVQFLTFVPTVVLQVFFFLIWKDHINVAELLPPFLPRCNSSMRVIDILLIITFKLIKILTTLIYFSHCFQMYLFFQNMYVSL